MPYANNSGVKIYYEVEGKGPPLVLLHGGFQDSDIWKECGYVDGLRSDYKLILRDDRAHGKSNKNYNPEEHTNENNAKDLIAILDELKIETAHVFGFSGGGQHALALAALAPERVKSLIVFGMTPNFAGSDANKQMVQLVQAGPEALIDFIEHSMPDLHVTEDVKRRVRATDFKALAAAMRQPPSVNVGKFLSAMTMPVLSLVGEDDNFFNPQKLREEYSEVPDLTFITLPGIGHSIERSDQIIPHVREFLARVSE